MLSSSLEGFVVTHAEVDANTSIVQTVLDKSRRCCSVAIATDDTHILALLVYRYHLSGDRNNTYIFHSHGIRKQKTSRKPVFEKYSRVLGNKHANSCYV